MKAANGLFYQWEGNKEAPVLILSNSLGTNFTMWNDQVKELKKNFHILRYDTRGHGQSDVTPGPYSIKGLAKDVIDLMDELKIKEAWFCGISIGGITGLQLGVDYQDRFLGFILANTSAKIVTSDVWKNRIKLVRDNGLEAVAIATPERWFTKEFLEKEKKLTSSVVDQILQTSEVGYIACCYALADCDLWNQIATIKKPTLIIAGEADAVTTVADAKKMVNAIEHASFKVLKANHLSNIEKWHDFNTALLSFTQIM